MDKNKQNKTDIENGDNSIFFEEQLRKNKERNESLKKLIDEINKKKEDELKNVKNIIKY